MTPSSDFVLCIMSLQMLWCGWLKFLKHISWYNPKHVRYRNLSILILFWTASSFTDYVFFDFLWPLPVVDIYRSLPPFQLKCSLQVVTCLCPWISKLRKRTISLSNIPGGMLFLRNIIITFEVFLFSLVSSTMKGSKAQT